MGNGTTGGTPAGNYNGAAFPAIPPCQDLCDLVAQIIQILYFMIGVGIWILIPVLFAWGGVMIMIARGNPTKASEARKILTGAVWGVVIMLCAWVIVSTFVTFFKLTGIGGFDKGGNCMVANPCGNPCPNGESCVWNGSAYGCGQ
jgi:heme/copper-type cytochrome/quinol oxidase subunit 2